LQLALPRLLRFAFCTLNEARIEFGNLRQPTIARSWSRGKATQGVADRAFASFTP
jgi:hypothetical protein